MTVLRGYICFSTGIAKQTAVDDEEALSITSYACQWKVSQRRKQSTLEVSLASFEKHVYGKHKKRFVKPLEEFDPRPQFCSGTTNERLPKLLEKLRGK